MIPDDGCPGHPLNPDATRASLATMAPLFAMLDRDVLVREHALRAGVPLLTIGMVDALTPSQRRALLACWPAERPTSLPTRTQDVWSEP